MMSNEPPQGAQPQHSGNPGGMREAAQALIDRYYSSTLWVDMIDEARALRTALAAPEGPAPEPVAWVDERAIAWLAQRLGKQSFITTVLEAKKSFERPMPLYATTAPEAPPPVEARQPPQSELAKSLAWSNDDGWRAQRLATEFHEIYERLAPIFGYETRPDTKQFDPNSKNGKLMIAVCGNILAALAAPAGAIQPPLDHQVGAAVTPLPLDSAGGAPSATAPREHEANEHCWCEPEVDYVDPNTGAKVFVHKQTQ